jgi:signal transduction histidine kinase
MSEPDRGGPPLGGGDRRGGGEPRGGDDPRGHGESSDDFFQALSIPLLAHELKGPLAVIEAGVSTALERAGEGAEAAKLARTLHRVLRSTRRAQALVDDLLEVGRAEAGQIDRAAFRPAEILIDSVVSAVEAMDAELADRVADHGPDTVTAALSTGGVELAITDRARSSVVEQDQRKFALIAANLVRNALRFRRARVQIGLDVDAGAARLTVEDDGPGVAPEDRERIFERWARGADSESGSRQGHGLGLAAARILARGMGGDVTLDPESASRFVLTVPI